MGPVTLGLLASGIVCSLAAVVCISLWIRGPRPVTAAAAIALSLAALVLIIIVLLLSDSPPAAPPTTATPPPPPTSKPAPPVFTSRKFFEAEDNSMEGYRGKRVVVVGPVTKVDTTSFTARVSWNVPEGLGCAYLSDDPEKDQPQVICVFRGGRPASLRVGATCRIEGTYRGILATSGVPLLIECEPDPRR